MSIQIDDEFRRLLLPLSYEEKRQLEENIVADGCREPLVVWRASEWTPDDWGRTIRWDEPDEESFGEEKGESYKVWEFGDEEVTSFDWPLILIDGHNRYEICIRRDVHFDLFVKEFDSRDDAADWIDANQEGRRNAKPDQLSLIRGRRYNRAKKKHGGEREASRQNDDLPKTAEVLAKQLGVSPRTIERDGKFAEAVEVLGMDEEVAAGELAAPKAAIVEAAKPIIAAKKAHEKWEEEVKRTNDRWEEEAKQRPLAPPPPPKVTIPEPPRPTIEDIQKAKAHVSHNSGENEWYTPPEYLESARAVLNRIDCDPASSEIANKSVKAEKFFTKDDNGLEQEWFGNVWMNPPYAQPLIAQFSEAVASKYESSEIDSAIVLVNNATETNWFQRMAGTASAACFPKGRIRFLDPKGNPGAPLQGQAIMYFGTDGKAFAEEFKKYGSVYHVDR